MSGGVWCNDHVPIHHMDGVERLSLRSQPAFKQTFDGVVARKRQRGSYRFAREIIFFHFGDSTSRISFASSKFFFSRYP